MKGNMKFGIILVLTLLCIGIGIWLPGQPFEMQEDSKEMKNAEQVPQEYLASSTAVSRNASLNLKIEEKIGLICGTWASTNKKITVSGFYNKDKKILDKFFTMDWNNRTYSYTDMEGKNIVYDEKGYHEQ